MVFFSIFYLSLNIYAQQIELSVTKSEYYRGEIVPICLHNGGREDIVLPNPNSWQVIDIQGRVIFTPKVTRGHIKIGFGETKWWNWEGRDRSGEFAKPNTYRITLETENFDNPLTSETFKIVQGKNPKKSAKNISRGAILTALIGSAVASPLISTVVGGIALGLIEGGTVVLGFIFEDMAEDPPAEEYTQKVVPMRISLDLPEPKSSFDYIATRYVEDVAQTVESLRVLVLSLERFEAAKEANNTDFMSMHSESAQLAAALLTIEGNRLDRLSNSLYRLADELKLLNFDISIPSEVIRNYQRSLKEVGFPTEEEIGIDELALMKDFMMTEEEIGNIINLLFSLPIEGDSVNLYSAMESLRQSLLEIRPAIISIAKFGL